MRTLVILVLCFAACTSASGQDSQIFGLIRDPSNANVDGAEITLRNEQTGGARKTKSNESGRYNLPALRPGGYRLTVRAAGFQTIVREGIQLNVGEDARIDFVLSIGASQTTITVHDDHLLTNTTDASIGTVIGRTLIDQLPLSGRQIQTLVELSPGVTVIPVFDVSRGQFVINGQRSDASYFTIDGVSVNFGAANSATRNIATGGGFPSVGQAGGGILPATNFLGTFSNLLSPEAVEEFKIQTSTYAPEFGHLPGGQIALISRSGSTRYSGSLYEYFRNSATDANDWFNNAQGLPKAALRFDNFGGTLGGPLRFPRHPNGKDRSFFFLSVDQVTIHQSQPANTERVPTLSTRQNAPPALATFLDAYPLPTSDVDPSGNSTTSGYAQFVGASALQQKQRTYGLRVDHHFSDKFSLFLRFSHSPSERVEPIPHGNASNIEADTIVTSSITAGLTQSISSNLVNELRLNISRQSGSSTADVNGAFGAIRPEISQFLPAGYSGANSQVDFDIDNSDPYHITTVSLGLFSKNEANQIQAVDNVYYSVGPHLLKFGVDCRRFSPIQIVPAYSTFFSFDSIFTTPGSYVSTIPFIANGVNPSKTAYVVPTFGAFAQDTWRITPRFTINYGLRWEADPAPRVSAGQALVEGGLTNLNDISNAHLLAAGQPFYPTAYGNIAPRVGAAWQFSSRGQWMSVLRAGAGIFFSSAQGGFEDTGSLPVAADIFRNQPLGSIGTGTPSEIRTFASTQTVFAAAPHYKLPVVYQWNVTLEQSVGKQTLSAGYVGSAGRRLIGLATLPGPPPFYGLDVLGNDASSDYNSLQLQFNRRLSHRLQILTSYTFSHSIDNLSKEIPSRLFQRPLSQYLDPDADRGSSDFDIRHTLTGAVIAELPAPHNGLAAVFLRNWSVNGIFFARSALPTDIVGELNGGDLRPNVVPGQPLYLYGSQYPGGKSYNYAAFAHTADGVEGNFGRNVLRGFGAWQLDFAMHRQFEFSDKASVELRVEAFNILNHPNFANPTTLTDPTVLYLAPTPHWGESQTMLANGLSHDATPGELNPLFQMGGPRSLQFGLRLRY